MITKDDHGNEQVIEDVRSFTLEPPRLANLAWFKQAKYLDNFDIVPDDQFVQVVYARESWSVAVHQDQRTSTDEEIADRQKSVVTQHYFISPEGKVSEFEPHPSSGPYRAER